MAGETPKKKKLKPSSEHIWRTLVAISVATGFAFFAKGNAQIRDWLIIYAPWADDLIAVAFQESSTYKEIIYNTLNNVFNFFNIDLELDSDVFLKTISITPSEPDDKPCEPVPPEGYSCNICEYEKCIKDISNNIVANYQAATMACYNHQMDMQYSANSVPYRERHKIDELVKNRKYVVEKALENIAESDKKISLILDCLDYGVHDKDFLAANSPDKIEESRNLIAGLQTLKHRFENDFNHAQHMADQSDLQWQQVQNVMEKYAQENQSVFKGLDYNDKKPKVTDGVDFLLIRTKKYLEQLTIDLCDSETKFRATVQRGFCDVNMGLKQRDKAIKKGFKKGHAVLQKEFTDRITAFTKALENDRQHQLQENQALAEENTEKCIERSTRELQESLDQKLNNTMLMTKIYLQKELDEVSTQLKDLEEKLEVRLKAEKVMKKSQKIFYAANSILQATKRGESIVQVNDQLKTLQKCSADDKLVQTVLKAVPNSIWSDGIVPESVLQDKYYKMEDVALKVALVKSDGAPLPVYFLSWLQHLLLIKKVNCIKQSEIDDPFKEPDKNLDTFDLLQRARYFVERSNLTAALRYVDALQGASRGAAESWYQEARAHVETKQAAEAFLAHSVALTLKYI